LSSRPLSNRQKKRDTKGAYQIREKQNGDMTIVTRFSEIEVSFRYPDENPSDAIQQITTCLNYVGAFEGIKQM
jgi:hypothetical protein